MLKIKSLYSKIILPAVLVLLLLVITMTVHSSMQFADFTDTLFKERITVTSYGLKDHLSNLEHNSRVAAISISANINVVRTVKERDRDGIVSIFPHLLELYGVDVITVTDEAGIVLARTHASDAWGDSILYQHLVADALEGKVSTYYEEGSYVSVSVRSGSPVYDADGTLIGVVTAGSRLDDSEAVDYLKKRFDSEFTVFLRDTRIATTIMLNGERIIGTRLAPDIARIVIGEKKEYNGDVTILGEDYSANYLPLINADDEVFAIIFIGNSNIYLLDRRNVLLLDGALIGFIGLVVSVIVLLFTTKKAIEPVNQLKYLVSEVAKGNIDVDFSRKQVTNDEIGELELDVLSLIDVIQSVESDLAQLTREINTDSDIHFNIDASKYSGIHKQIIDDIIVLGNSISMKNKVMAAMDSLDSIIHVTDLDFNLIYVNRSAEKTFGIDLESYKGVKCYKALRNLDYPCSFCNLPQLLPDKESLPILNYEYMYDDVYDMWFGGRASIIRWTDGSLVFLQTSNIETEKKKAQQMLSEAA
ncbi:MAG: cache domain-containing protein, partial [Tannerella sp.]|nr:cache domain-containing protein [Tannerella sp.]